MGRCGSRWSTAQAASSGICGGAAGEGKYLRLDGDQGNQMELTGERIAIDPKKNYPAGGWFRSQQNNGSARRAWRINDARGKEPGRYSPTGNFNGDRWNYGVQRFGPGRNSVDLPKTAAWLEPQGEFSGRCRLEGIGRDGSPLPSVDGEKSDAKGLASLPADTMPQPFGAAPAMLSERAISSETFSSLWPGWML